MGAIAAPPPDPLATTASTPTPTLTPTPVTAAGGTIPTSTTATTTSTTSTRHPRPPSRPLTLMDLDDDTLGLIAGHCWAAAAADGFFGACRRTRAVGMAAIPDVSLEWCAACDGELPPPPTGLAAPAHPPCLVDRLPSTVAWLRRATHLRTAVLVDDADVAAADGGDADGGADADADAAAAVGAPPCAAVPPAVRAHAWQTVGATLVAAPLGALLVVGARAAAALGGLAAAVADPAGRRAAPPVRRLHLLAGADAAGAGGAGVAADLAAAAAAVAPTLEWLGVDARRGWRAGGARSALAAAGVLRSLRHVELRLTRGRGEVVDAATAAALAAAAPQLTSLVLEARVATGWGDALSLAAGALPRLAVLDLTLTAEDRDSIDDGGAPALTHVSLSAPAPLAVWDAAALAPLAACPALRSLSLTGGGGWGAPRAARAATAAALLRADVAAALPGVAVSTGVSFGRGGGW